MVLKAANFMKIPLHGKARAIPYALTLATIGIFLAFDTLDDQRRLISAAGILIFVVILALLSKHPRKIDWRQVTWGLVLQFSFALIILRWPFGKSVVKCLGEKIGQFLGFTNEGSSFVFGYLVTQKLFDENRFTNNSLLYNVTSEINIKKAVPSVVVFSALSVIYFFSFIVNILFHFGIIQSLTEKIGLALKFTIGTSSVESMSAASNIFLGQAMAPLLIKPYLADLTLSELHVVLTSGFSTIAGTVMAAYISFGVSPGHLLSASVMSAPAALASAKLLLPETEIMSEDQESPEPTGNGEEDQNNIQLASINSSSNLIEAATQGASSAAMLVLNITAIVVAFIAFVAFLNSLCSFFGGLIGHPEITFEWLLGYAFVPLAFIMGVDISECHMVGKLIGIKTVANEFIAYRELGLLIEAKKLSSRASIIATYALCGYANPGSIGVQLATLSSLCPQRKSDVSKVIFRAFIGGSVACFLTACIAGALLKDY